MLKCYFLVKKKNKLASRNKRLSKINKLKCSGVKYVNATKCKEFLKLIKNLYLKVSMPF